MDEENLRIRGRAYALELDFDDYDSTSDITQEAWIAGYLAARKDAE